MKNIQLSLRNVTRLRWANVFKITSLVLGLMIGGVLMVHTNYYNGFNKDFAKYDSLNFLMLHWDLSGGEAQNSLKALGPMAEQMAQDIPAITAATRFYSYTVSLKNGDRDFSTTAAMGDEHFFDVLGFEVLQGDPSEGLKQPNVIYLSESLAEKLFPEGGAVGGSLISNNKTTMTVGGIFRDIPQNNSLHRINAVYNSQGHIRSSWYGSDAFNTFFLTNPNVNRAELDSQINQSFEPHLQEMANSGYNISVFTQPASELFNHYNADAEASTLGIMTILGLFILAVTAFNFILMQINSLLGRAKEVGVHKASGARTFEIFGLIVWETIFYVLFSAALAALFVWALIGPLSALVGNLEVMFTIDSLWVIGGLLVVMILISGIVPAVIYARIPATEIFRSTKRNNLWWKQVLLLIEFSVAIIAIVALIGSSLQFRMLTKFDLGYNTENLYTFGTHGKSQSTVENLKNELKTLPYIKNVATSEYLILWGMNGFGIFDSLGQEVIVTARCVGVDYDFFDTYGIEIKHGGGEDLFKGESLIATELLLRNTASSYGDYNFRTELGEVVGIVGNVRNNLYNSPQPIIFIPLDTGYADNTWSYFTLRTSSPLSEGQREQISAITQKHLEVEEKVLITPYSQNIRDMYVELLTMRDAFGVGAIILLLITFIGVLSYISTEIKGRRREIAMRRVHGATFWQIITSISKRLLIVLGVASVVGVGLSWYALRTLFSMYFAEQITLEWWIFALSVFVVLVLVLLITYNLSSRIVRGGYARVVGKL